MTSVHMLLSMDLTEPAAAAVTTPAGSDASDVDAGAPSSGRRAVIAHRDLLEMLQKEVRIFLISWTSLFKIILFRLRSRSKLRLITFAKTRPSREEAPSPSASTRC